MNTALNINSPEKQIDIFFDQFLIDFHGNQEGGESRLTPYRTTARCFIGFSEKTMMSLCKDTATKLMRHIPSDYIEGDEHIAEQDRHIYETLIERIYNYLLEYRYEHSNPVKKVIISGSSLIGRILHKTS